MLQQDTKLSPEQQLLRLQTLLSTVSECFKVIDADCNLLDMNSAGLDLIEAESLEQVRGVCVLQLLLPQYHEEFCKGVQLALSGERVTQEFEIQGLGGTRRWMQQVAVAMPPRPGESKPTEVAAFTREITELRNTVENLDRARVEAQAADRAKSAFLANMSHEIRTPMTAILGYADLLADDPGHDSALEVIRSNAKHLLRLLNDILDVSKIEAGQLEIESIATNPVEIAERTMAISAARAREKAVELTVELETPIPENIASDPTRMQQILMNLVGNAVKFTDCGSVRLLMAYLPETHQLRFCVQDTGIGMTEAQCDKIRRFEAFSQADSSMTRRFGGSGLGLRISSSLAEKLGGGITVDSEPGRGSTFSVFVGAGEMKPKRWIEPGERGVSPGSVALPKPKASKVSLQGVRVLVAEDGPDNQRLICHYLQKAGATVTLCENGKIALETIEHLPPGKRPHVVFMDMQMPVMDGYDATKLLRAAEIDVPIIALTAHAMQGDRERCLEIGCDDYLSKPMKPREMLQRCYQWATRLRPSPG